MTLVDRLDVSLVLQKAGMLDILKAGLMDWKSVLWMELPLAAWKDEKQTLKRF